MRRYHSLILLTAIITLFSCKDSTLSSEVGIGIQPASDKITVKTDTFRVKSENRFIDKIYNRPDSLLLGLYDTGKYGEIEANILSQFEAPFNLAPEKRYPEGSTADSAFLILQYSSYFGSPNSTIKINVFELNKDKTFDYNTYYPSNIDPTEYVDTKNSLIGEKVFTANLQNPRGKAGQVRIKLKDEFKNKIFDLSKKYSNREEFLREFKGIFINTDLSDATIFNINGINMLLHHSYPTTIEGKDTLISNNTLFPSNDLVTKVNQIIYPNKKEIKEKLSSDIEYNYLSTPANIYTEVKLPVRKIIQDMQKAVGDKKLNINHAVLNIETEVRDNDNQDLTIPRHLLLVNEKNIKDFTTKISPEMLTFGEAREDKRKSGTTPIYSINIIPILTEAIIKAEKGKEEGKSIEESLDEHLNMILIPAVILERKNPQNNQITILGAAHKTAISNLQILSGKNSKSPMKIDITYSGF